MKDIKEIESSNTCCNSNNFETNDTETNITEEMKNILLQAPNISLYDFKTKLVDIDLRPSKSKSKKNSINNSKYTSQINSQASSFNRNPSNDKNKQLSRNKNTLFKMAIKKQQDGKNAYLDEDNGKIRYDSNSNSNKNINKQTDYKDNEEAYISDSSLVKYFGSESNNHSSSDDEESIKSINILNVIDKKYIKDVSFLNDVESSDSESTDEFVKKFNERRNMTNNLVISKKSPIFDKLIDFNGNKNDKDNANEFDNNLIKYQSSNGIKKKIFIHRIFDI